MSNIGSTVFRSVLKRLDGGDHSRLQKMIEINVLPQMEGQTVRLCFSAQRNKSLVGHAVRTNHNLCNIIGKVLQGSSHDIPFNLCGFYPCNWQQHIFFFNLNNPSL